MKAIGRLFADMGDAYAQLIATGRKATYLSPLLLLPVCMIILFDINSVLA